MKNKTNNQRTLNSYKKVRKVCISGPELYVNETRVSPTHNGIKRMIATGHIPVKVMSKRVISKNVDAIVENVSLKVTGNNLKQKNMGSCLECGCDGSKCQHGGKISKNVYHPSGSVVTTSNLRRKNMGLCSCLEYGCKNLKCQYRVKIPKTFSILLIM